MYIIHSVGLRVAFARLSRKNVEGSCYLQFSVLQSVYTELPRKIREVLYCILYLSARIPNQSNYILRFLKLHSSFPTKILHVFLFSSAWGTRPTRPIHLGLIAIIILSENLKLPNSSAYL